MMPKFRIRNSFLILTPILASGILIAFQFLTLERMKTFLLEDASVRTYRLGLGDKIPSMIKALHPVDWILICSLAVLTLWLIIMELGSRRLSRELDRILASEKATLIFLGAMAVAISRFYLAPGQFVLGDSPIHISRIWAAGESLALGKWPSWSFYNYGGFPLLQFYGPLFFVIAGSISDLIGNIDWAAKAVLFLCQSGSAFPVYWWSRSIGSGRQTALIGALAYILCFQHTYSVIWTGALPVALIYLLFPILFLSAERLLSTPSKRWIILLALTTAAVILCHHGYALSGLQLLILYIGLRWILPGTARPKSTHVLTSVLGILGGSLLCSGFLWPILTGSSGISQLNGIPLLTPGIPDFNFLKKIFTWRNAWSGWSLSYIGVTMFAFAVVGGIQAWRHKHKTKEESIKMTVALLAVFSFLSAARVGRDINPALLFIAVLSGGVAGLHIRKIPYRLPLIAIALLLLDLGPTTIQAPYRTDRKFLREGLRRAAGLIDPHRALVGYASEKGTHYYHWGANEDTGLILPTGYFPQGAPRSINSINAMVDALNTPSGIADSTRINFLYLWDVSGLILHSRDRFVKPEWKDSRADDSDPPIAWIHPASPLLFSEHIAIAADDTLKELQGQELLIQRDRLDPLRKTYLRRMMHWVDRMRINRNANTADQIFIAGAGPDSLPYAGMDPPGLSIQHYRVELDYVSIRYRAAKAGYLRLAFSWFPTLHILIDGQETAPFRSLLGAIVIPTEAGDHTIELIPGRTKARSISSILGIIAAVLVLTPAWRFGKD